MDVIKAAYRNKVKQLHPDVNKSPAANEEFIAVKQAFDILSKQQRTGGVRYQNPSAHGPVYNRHYKRGSFYSFYTRQASKQQYARKSGANVGKMPAGVKIAIGTVFFIIGMAIIINSILSLVRFEVPQRISGGEYIMMLFFTLVIGAVFAVFSGLLVFTGAQKNKTSE